jgi:hypothetical protein
MKFLSRDDIVKAQDIKPEPVAVPEWGGSVLMRCGTGDERDDYETSIWAGKGENRELVVKRMRAKLVSMAIVDEDGKRLFSEEDIVTLSRKNGKVIGRLFDIAQSMWGYSEKDIQSLLGESRPGLNAGHGIDSPGNGVISLQGMHSAS